MGNSVDLSSIGFKERKLTSGVPVDVGGYTLLVVNADVFWGFGRMEYSTDGVNFNTLRLTNIDSGTRNVEEIHNSGRYMAELDGIKSVRWIQEYVNAPDNGHTLITAYLSIGEISVEPMFAHKDYYPVPPHIRKWIKTDDPLNYRRLTYVDITNGVAYYVCGNYQVFKSDGPNYGSTFVEISSGPDAWGLTNRQTRHIIRLDSGNLLAWVHHTDDNKMHIWRSDATGLNFTDVYNYPYENEFNPSWPLRAVGDIIFFVSYTMSRPISSPQTVHRSLDGGITWKIVQAAPTSGVSNTWHFHDIYYSEYWGLTILINGDGSGNANVQLSRDFGDTWHKVWQDGKAPVQFTVVMDLPDMLLFGSDQPAERGIYRYVPEEDIGGVGHLEPLRIWTDGYETGDAVARSGTSPVDADGVAYFISNEFVLVGDPMYPAIWWTVGDKVHQVWKSPFVLTEGSVLGNFYGPCKYGKLVAYLRNNGQISTLVLDAPVKTKV